VHTAQSDADHGNLIFTKADTVVVSGGATFEIGAGTTLKTNVLKLFPSDQDNYSILTSPNGTKYKITVDDSGNLSTTPV